MDRILNKNIPMWLVIILLVVLTLDAAAVTSFYLAPHIGTNNSVREQISEFSNKDDIKTNAPSPTKTMQPTPKKLVVTHSPTSTPTTNPNKDSICKNQAQLQTIKFKENMTIEIKKTVSEYYSFDAAKAKYPGEWISTNYDETYMSNRWFEMRDQLYKPRVDALETLLEREAQKLYLQLYNQCLQN